MLSITSQVVTADMKNIMVLYVVTIDKSRDLLIVNMYKINIYDVISPHS